jgi:hypothetical protein
VLAPFVHWGSLAPSPSIRHEQFRTVRRYNSRRCKIGRINASRKAGVNAPEKVGEHEPAVAAKVEQDGSRPSLAHSPRLPTGDIFAGENPILRRLKDNAELRATANRRTIETLQRRGLIAMAKVGGVLNPTVWRLTSKASREIAHDTGRT